MDGLSLYPSYFGLTDSDPLGLWTFEVGPNGEIWVVSEGNTLADLMAFGYDPALLLALSPCGNLDEWIPVGSKFNIFSFLHKTVQDAARHQQQMQLTRDRFMDFLKRYDFDPELGIDGIISNADDRGCSVAKW